MKKERTKKEKDKQQDKYMLYYCPKQEEESWGVIEAIVDTGCEATIIGEL